jgi:hypothetical protein
VRDLQLCGLRRAEPLAFGRQKGPGARSAALPRVLFSRDSGREPPVTGAAKPSVHASVALRRRGGRHVSCFNA